MLYRPVIKYIYNDFKSYLARRSDIVIHSGNARFVLKQVAVMDCFISRKVRAEIDCLLSIC